MTYLLTSIPRSAAVSGEETEASRMGVGCPYRLGLVLWEDMRRFVQLHVPTAQQYH